MRTASASTTGRWRSWRASTWRAGPTRGCTTSCGSRSPSCSTGTAASLASWCRGRSSFPSPRRRSASVRLLAVLQPQRAGDALHGAVELLAQRLGLTVEALGDLVPAQACGAEVGEVALVVVEALAEQLQ